MRKLATIRRIDSLTPIAGADAIECATVGGWKVVAQKGLYNVGDLAVYFEIDSWIPHNLAPFLSKGKEPREFEGVKGERLRTIRLRGQLSQGLLMPLHEVISSNDNLVEGDDVTEYLGIKKWEKPIPVQLAGVCKGNFPTQIPKTDQERVQNLSKEINSAHKANQLFEVTEKLEGSSMTVYQIQGEFGVCSRNMDLKRDTKNTFWATAIAEGIEEKMKSIDPNWDFAIQGELVGPSIQGNIYKLDNPMFYVFDVYNIQTGEYLNPADRANLVKKLGLNHVPVLAWEKDLGTGQVDYLLEMADGKSVLGDTLREGLVYKDMNGGMSFKAISNEYLINQK